MEDYMNEATLLSFLEAIKKIAEKNGEPKTAKDIEDMMRAAIEKKEGDKRK